MYVPSGCEAEETGFSRVVPNKFFSLRFSSYQSEAFVASLLEVNGAGTAVVGPFSVRCFLVAFDVDDAVTAAFLRRLLIRRPSSSSDDTKSESESEAGGGVAGFLRKLALPLERFLKATWGTASATSVSSPILCIGYWQRLVVDVQAIVSDAKVVKMRQGLISRWQWRND